MPGLGEEFRAAREARHLSLSDVSEQIHIRAVYLQSLEDEEWSAIAAPVYVRGFIRTYARFLGLPGEQAVAHFNESIGASAKQNELSAAPPRRRPSVWLFVATAAALLLVAFVGYNYYIFQQQSPSSQTAAATSTAASDAATTDPAAAASTAPSDDASNQPASTKPTKPSTANPTLEVRVTQASWLLVTIDGKQRLEGIFPAGTTKEFHGNSVTIRAGNAGGVHLAVNGKELGSMGPSGAVVDRTIGLAEE
jgi:cytoskeleton protein RodZ